jgi:hypothetical protein
MEEFLLKLYNDLIDNQLYFNALSVYQCGAGGVTDKKDERWVPQEKDCGGIAPIANVLEDTILPALRQSQLTNNTLVIVSDGYWCGPHEKVTDFELTCMEEKLAKIVEVNVNSNVKNLTSPKNVSLLSTENNVTKKILDVAKGNKTKK